jgi:putative component of membrane protein insertase Oxa1/YidC/SpoIIIJ protein YidD
MPSEIRKLRQLEEENTRLRRIVADIPLDKEMFQGLQPSQCIPGPSCSCYNLSLLKTVSGMALMMAMIQRHSHLV